MDIISLLEAYKIARKSKARTEGNVNFDISFEGLLIKLCDDINSRTFTADKNYSFIVLEPKPREIFAAEMILRVVHHWIEEKLRPLVEADLTPSVFNNRKGYGGEAAIRKVQKDIKDLSKNYTSECWIMKLDIKGFFPNAKWDVAYSRLESLIQKNYFSSDKDDLLYLVKTCLYSDPARHCILESSPEMWNKYIEPEKSLFSKPYGEGGAIGFLIWQLAMTYYPADIDRYIVDNYPDIRYTRFVDDSVFIGTDKKQMLKLYGILRGMYKNIGCTVNEKKFYFQSYEHGLEFLGSHIKMDRIYLNNRTIAKAFVSIDNLNKIQDKEDRVIDFLQTVNSYLGMLRNRNSYGALLELLRYVDPEWWLYFTVAIDKNTKKIKKVVLKDQYKKKRIIV